MSVWVEIEYYICYGDYKSSRSTWACELKCLAEDVAKPRPPSRSTWACELKFIKLSYSSWVLSHAPRERVSWNACCAWSDVHNNGHAPRERVSWNYMFCWCVWIFHVTLHVSVWVEMTNMLFCAIIKVSRSTWACELKYISWNRQEQDHLSRSTWACELKFVMHSAPP